MFAPCLALLIVPGSALAAEALLQQGPRLVPTDVLATGPQEVGHRVALSDDGNTAIVSGRGGPPSAWVFVRTAGKWTQQGPGLPVASAPNIDSAVAISGDGDTALVSSRSDEQSHIFVRADGAWSEQQKIGKTSSTVALSQNGNTALFAAENGSVCGGNVRVFARSGATWSAQDGGSGLAPTDGFGAGCFGSVDLSADGNTAVFSGNDNSGDGATWTFKRNAGTWSQAGAKLPRVGGPQISGDSQTMVGSRSGSFVTFAALGSAWSAINEVAGFSALLSADGQHLVNLFGGAPGTGALRAYMRSGSGWAPSGNPIFPDDEMIGSPSGFVGAVAASADGSTVVAGAPTEEDGLGHRNVGSLRAFALQPAVTLNVNRKGVGRIGGMRRLCAFDACSEDFAPGTTVTLIPIADQQTFTGWTGACTGAGSCTVTLNQSSTVSAWFGQPPVGPGAGAPSAGPATVPAALRPRILGPKSAKRSSLIAGIRFSLDHLLPRSTVTLRVRAGTEELGRYRTKASKSGRSSLRLSLTRRQVKALRSGRLLLTWTIKGADAKSRVVATRLRLLRG